MQAQRDTGIQKEECRILPSIQDCFVILVCHSVEGRNPGKNIRKSLIEKGKKTVILSLITFFVHRKMSHEET